MRPGWKTCWPTWSDPKGQTFFIWRRALGGCAPNFARDYSLYNFARKMYKKNAPPPIWDAMDKGFCQEVFQKFLKKFRVLSVHLPVRCVHAYLCSKAPDKISCDGRHFLLTMIVYHILSYLSIGRLYKVSGKSLSNLSIDNAKSS